MTASIPGTRTPSTRSSPSTSSPRARGRRSSSPARSPSTRDTGQLVTTFDDNPQVPFSRFTLALQGRPAGAAGHSLGLRHLHDRRPAHPCARPDQPVTAPTPSRSRPAPAAAPAPPARRIAPSTRPRGRHRSTTIAGSYSPFVLRMTRARRRTGDHLLLAPTSHPA